MRAPLTNLNLAHMGSREKRTWLGVALLGSSVPKSVKKRKKITRPEMHLKEENTSVGH